MLLVLLAGADTTGNTVQSILVETLRQPRIYQTLVAELDAVTASGALSAVPQWDELVASCPYLVACVREALHLHPSGSGILPRVAGKHGVKLGP